MTRFLKILIFLLFLLPSGLLCQIPAESSVLSGGKWFRIAVTADGIYRIDYSRLRDLGLENPSNPRIYGNNFGQLSYFNSDPKPDDLQEMAVYISGNDNILNEGEYLLFFARGTGRWIYDREAGDFSYRSHNYSDTAYYFITSAPGPGKRILTESPPSRAADYFSAESDALFFYQKDQVNLIKSGREWFQRISDLTIDPGFTSLNTGEGIRYELRVAARASTGTAFDLYEGSVHRKNVSVAPVNLYNTTGTYAEITDSSGTAWLSSGSPVYRVSFDNKGEQGAYGWLDYLAIRARRFNVFDGRMLEFSDSRSVSAGRVTQCTVNSSTAGTFIWDVSDPFGTMAVPYDRQGASDIFSYSSDSLRSFVAFSPDKVLVPFIRQAPVPNQNLHASGPADMIIITHPLFLEYARKLAAIHTSENGLVSLVVTPEQVYNEFSGGIPDICALRNFIRMMYLRQKGTSHSLKYLLLFGDGSYENRTPPPANPNFIPTYQSQNSNIETSSFTSDDFYGLLDDGEGESDGTEDIGIGRLPVTDTVQAGVMIAKILKYTSPASMGDWKNVVCLAADDEDGNIHLNDAEGLAKELNDSVPFINVDKIYLDAYKQITSGSGESYPAVNKAITDRINSGCLIFNYVGHGNENGLAQEQVVKTADINSWTNNDRLPLFITATCEFSRFDDMDINVISGQMTEKTSAGEMVLLNRNGGGIALMTTTRLVYSAPNYTLNRNIYSCAFERDENGNALTFGDIIRIAKNRTGNGPNKRNFTLLGDPALRLAFPWHGKIITDSLNNAAISENTDSLKALSLITIAGHVENMKGGMLDSFNGIVSPVVFDKPDKVRTLANDGGTSVDFDVRNNILFSGKTRAGNGRFRFTFIVPRDINYNFGNGKISYYASSGSDDMTGYFNDIVVGGFSGKASDDDEGPEIRLFMNDTLFRSGGMTGGNPTLMAIIGDRTGINTSGASIGHDLEGFLDNDRENPFNLNGYFENDFDDYTRGRVTYDLVNLSPGSHTVTVKAWDNSNNSSEASLDFRVENGNKLILSNPLCYPNPSSGEIHITAGFNRPGEVLDITINIFSLDGRVIKIIKARDMPEGFVLTPVIWDGTIGGGGRAGRGIYPFSVVVTTGSGETAIAHGRIIIL